jgi:hypothetical protein
MEITHEINQIALDVSKSVVAAPEQNRRFANPRVTQ